MVLKNDLIVRVGGAEIVCRTRAEAIRVALDIERLRAEAKPDGRHAPLPKQEERALAEEALRILAGEGKSGIESAMLARKLELVSPQKLGRIALAIKHFLGAKGLSRDDAFTTERRSKCSE